MASKRLVRKFTDVVAEVERQIKAHYNVTEKELAAWRARAKASLHKFPSCTMIQIKDIWIDYEVQRDVIHKHVINIMKNWDARLCSPGSACRIAGDSRILLYDAQHRAIALAILGFDAIPCAIVDTQDPNFASYAFEQLNSTGVKRLTPGDLHRNALVRYKNGSREIKNVQARALQDQFDKLEIDLQDKGSRNSDTLRGENDYFFSHFKYAQKAIEVDASGKVLYQILDAIKTVFPLGEEIDQGVFIGLYELHRIARTSPNIKLDKDWMKILLNSIKPTFKSASLIHAKAKVQWEHKNPGATWSAPSAMSNFMRELHIRAGGTLALPYHGEGAKMGIEDGFIAPGLFPDNQLAA